MEKCSITASFSLSIAVADQHGPPAGYIVARCTGTIRQGISWTWIQYSTIQYGPPAGYIVARCTGTIRQGMYPEHGYSIGLYNMVLQQDI